MLLSSAHFPPIHYFSKFIHLEEIFIEANENYQKQSWRNRFNVLAANGPITLSVPLIKGRTPGQAIKSVKIDYSEGWNKVHLKTIISAYNHSPFYEFFIDDLLPFWEKKWIFIYDLNMEILKTIIEIMQLDIKIKETRDYSDLSTAKQSDFRYSIHPKIPWQDDHQFESISYPQNFSDRHGFTPNLSILDLLFQKGPESLDLIKKSRKL